MRYKLSAPATLHTTVQLPASKSISNRALILHALAQGHITPTNLSDCDDTCVMIKALDGNPEPVSYTHLDVYKRQVFRLCTEGREPSNLM